MDRTNRKWAIGMVAALVLVAGGAVAEAHPHDRGPRGPEQATRMREKVAGKLERLRQRMEVLGTQGRISPRVLDRFRSLHTKVVERTERIFGDGRVTPGERQDLRALKQHVNRFKRSVRAAVGREAWRASGPSDGGRHRGRHGGRHANRNREAGRERGDDRELPPPDDERWDELPSR